MDTITLRRYEEKLLGRKHEILPVLKHLDEESQSILGTRHFDLLDRAWDESEAYLVDRLTEYYQRELESIETALSRVRTGTFGSCRACHQQIEPARLDRFPQVEFCAECKATRENFERAL